MVQKYKWMLFFQLIGAVEWQPLIYLMDKQKQLPEELRKPTQHNPNHNAFYKYAIV